VRTAGSNAVMIWATSSSAVSAAASQRCAWARAGAISTDAATPTTDPSVISSTRLSESLGRIYSAAEKALFGNQLSTLPEAIGQVSKLLAIEG
jgi:hypothetical protein